MSIINYYSLVGGVFTIIKMNWTAVEYKEEYVAMEIKTLRYCCNRNDFLKFKVIDNDYK